MAHALPKLAGVKHRYLDIGEDMFHVAILGDESEKPPVLLLHGWPTHWYSWRGVMPSLAEDRQVIAMDLRGFGWSDVKWSGFDKENLADDVLRVLERLEIGEVDMIGHGWGAWVGYLLALRENTPLRRLVAVSSPPPWIKPTPENVKALAPDIQQALIVGAPIAGQKLIQRTPYVARQHRGRSYRGKAGARARQFYVRDTKASTRALASTYLYRSFLLREALPVLLGRYRHRELQVPVLAIAGKNEPLGKQVFASSAKPGLEVEFFGVSKAGHFVPEEQPEALVKRARSFFDD